MKYNHLVLMANLWAITAIISADLHAFVNAAICSMVSALWLIVCYGKLQTDKGANHD